MTQRYKISNGTIINENRMFKADVLFADGKIERIAPCIDEAAETIDASGMYVIPGGIDPHVHFDLPTPVGNSADDFASGSKAALMGGTTSYIDFVTPSRNEKITDALQNRIEIASASYTDYSLHLSVTSWYDGIEEELSNLVSQGFPSVKVYLAYLNTVGIDDTVLEKTMNILSRSGGLILVHCEDGLAIERLQQVALQNGKHLPIYHALTRPEETEATAVNKVIEISSRTGCPAYIVHLSAKQSLGSVRKAKFSKQPIYAETCPHYLLLDESCYKKDLPESLIYILSPPLRKKENQTLLWEGLNDGTLSVVATDHCPFNLQQKKVGLDDFTKVPNGAGSVESRLQLLFTYGVMENRITLQQWVALCSVNPAKIFGLYPQKGCIAKGTDADIVIWNPEYSDIIRAEKLYQRCDNSVYEGFPVKGRAEYVFTRGVMRVKEGIFTNEGFAAQLLKRKGFNAKFLQ